MGASPRSRVPASRDLAFALAFVAVVLFGALLRIARLHSIPPGLFFDEAANLFDISDVLNGAHPLYFPRNNGREPFFFYWASLFASVWGLTPFAIRLASAVIGAMTVVTTFFCAREMLRAWRADRRWADWTALAAAFVLSITYTHLHYSRIGLRSITLPFFLALSYGLLFRGLRRDSWWSLAFAGGTGGLSLYTYISSRIAPLPLLAVPLLLGFPRRTWRPFWQAAFVGIVWVAVCLPLGIYAYRHPSDVLGHTDDVSNLNPANDHGDPRGAVVHGVLATLGAFSFVGTQNADQNLPGRPILDPVLSLFFFAGLAALALGTTPDCRLDATAPGTSTYRSAGRAGSIEHDQSPVRSADRPASLGSQPVTKRNGALRGAVASFLVLWILSQSVPSALAVGPPGFIRMTGALPAVAIVASFGVGYAFRWLASLLRIATEAGKHDGPVDRSSGAGRPGQLSPRPRVSASGRRLLPHPLVGAATIVGVALAISTIWTARDYFWIWGPSTVAYHWMMGDKVDSATYLNRWAVEDRLFLAPLFAQDNTIKFLTRNSSIQSFDLGASLVVPTDRSRSARYVFPASDAQEIASVARELPAQTTTESVKDPSGRFTLLTSLDVPSAALPSVPATRIATFDGGIALVAASIGSGSPAPDQKLSIVLEWLDLQRQPYDYTVFVHLRDSTNHAVAQVDRQPTAGSFPTTAWRRGDLIWDRYTLAVPATAGPGTYHLVVGLYRLATLQRLAVRPATGPPPSNEVIVGTVTIGAKLKG